MQKKVSEEKNEEIQRERILKMVKKIKLKKQEWNAFGVMLLISRREKMREQEEVRKYLKTRAQPEKGWITR